MMKKISWLSFMAVFLALFSCRNDLLPEQQAYDNSSQFRLTSKRISLDQSRHKTKLISELEQAEAVLKKANTSVNGKLVSYGNFIIDTDQIVYIENGPNYHTYTFRIVKQNEQADAPVENLIFTPLTDGTYRKLLVTYYLTPQEKQLLQSGVQISTKGKATVTVLGTGTLNIPTAKTIQVCGYVAYEYYTWCSANEHNNGEGSGECSAGVKSHLVTGYMYTCEYLDTGGDNGADGAPSGTGSSGSGDNGGGSGGENQYTWQCPNPQVFTGPQQAGSDTTDQEGCYVVPTEPNIGEPETPCEKTKNMLQNQEIKDKINALYDQSKLNGEKGFMVQPDGTPGALIPGNETSVQLGDISGNIGYYHNHPADQPNRKGIKIHSVPDIYKLFEFIVNQPPGTPVSDSFAGMVTSMPCDSPADCPPDGYLYHNFVFTFTGTLEEAQAIKNTNYDFKTLSNDYSTFEQSIKNKAEYASQYGNFMNFKGLEKVFYNALDDMGIDKNKINLQRIDRNGKVYNISLDATGTPKETLCP